MRSGGEAATADYLPFFAGGGVTLSEGAGSQVNLPAMISERAISELPMRAPVSIMGRWPALSWRTRLETTLTKIC